MPIFDWCIAGSGSQIKYGGATIGVEKPLLVNDHYDNGRAFVVVEPSGTTAYFTHLNSLYTYAASGWNE